MRCTCIGEAAAAAAAAHAGVRLVSIGHTRALIFPGSMLRRIDFALLYEWRQPICCTAAASIMLMIRFVAS